MAQPLLDDVLPTRHLPTHRCPFFSWPPERNNLVIVVTLKKISQYLKQHFPMYNNGLHLECLVGFQPSIFMRLKGGELRGQCVWRNRHILCNYIKETCKTGVLPSSLSPTTLNLPLLLLADMMCVTFIRCLVDPAVPLTVDRANEHREEVTAVQSPTGLLVIKSVQTMSSFSLRIPQSLYKCHLLSIEGWRVTTSPSPLQGWELTQAYAHTGICTHKGEGQGAIPTLKHTHTYTGMYIHEGSGLGTSPPTTHRERHVCT